MNVFVGSQIPKDRLSFSQATSMHSKWQSELFQTKSCSLSFLLFPTIHEGMWWNTQTRNTAHVKMQDTFHHLRQISSESSFSFIFSGTCTSSIFYFWNIILVEFCSSFHDNNLNLFCGQKAENLIKHSPLPCLPSGKDKRQIQDADFSGGKVSTLR